MDTFFENLSSAVLDFADTFHKDVVVRVLNESRYVEEPERFYYTIAHKTNSTLFTVNHVIRNFHTHYHTRIGMYILFRAIMADIVTAEYVTRQNPEDEDRKVMITRIYADHIYHTYRSIDKSVRHVFKFTDADVQKMQENLRLLHPVYFEGTDFKIKELKTSVYTMAKELALKSTGVSDLYFIERAFNYYDLFSKYEHPGALSFHLTHRVYETKKMGVEYKELYACLQITLAFLVTIVNLWDYDRKPFEALADKVLSFTPDKFNGLLSGGID